MRLIIIIDKKYIDIKKNPCNSVNYYESYTFTAVRKDKDFS